MVLRIGPAARDQVGGTDRPVGPRQTTSHTDRFAAGLLDASRMVTRAVPERCTGAVSSARRVEQPVLGRIGGRERGAGELDVVDERSRGCCFDGAVERQVRRRVRRLPSDAASTGEAAGLG